MQTFLHCKSFFPKYNFANLLKHGIPVKFHRTVSAKLNVKSSLKKKDPIKQLKISLIIIDDEKIENSFLKGHVNKNLG